MLKNTRFYDPINDFRREVARRLMHMMFGSHGQPTSEPLPEQGIYRILICHVSHSLGNTLLLTPLLVELEKVYPGAEIDILTRSPIAKDIYGHFFSVQRIFPLPAHGVGHPFQFFRTLRRMRKQRYDLAIDADALSHTGRLLMLLSNATYTLGFSGPKKHGEITHAVPLPEHLESKGRRPVYLLRSAMDRDTTADYPVPDIRLGAGEREQGRAVLTRSLVANGITSPGRGIIGIFGNATGTKLLGETWWTRFLQVLEAQCPDHRIVEILPASGQSMLSSRYPGYYSSDLRKMASVLSGLDVYISSDCGIMHLACASHVPTLGIFTITRTDEWGPYGPGRHAIAAHGVEPEDVARTIMAMPELTSGIRI
ncbi:lipopolysaccharide heptosyltransferase family protein [Dyella sp. M7H15-1]|uniref:glycosyltransferase family 9 protein n=1 Tax=Dyella sp. M7H15-1 TaxID=2501295 RepID=UPI001005002A|nr:glycosyltransferase family 9 protein [Dyella sp. M7H15-1]QAU23306.1 lipopolysaccharide heptosyltransferase family protein [Dyella sp. M7H15-1]